MKKRIIYISAVLVIALFVGFMFPKAYSAMDNTYSKLKVLMEVLSLTQENYVDEVDTEELIYGAARGIVQELDPYSEFMDPERFAEMKEDSKGEFTGIGVRLSPASGELAIITPIPGTPAYKAGIKPGDKIIKVNGKPTIDMTIDESIKNIRGKAGTTVLLTIGRKDSETGEWKILEEPIKIKRAKIIPEVVKYRMLDDKIGYIYVMDFSGHTVEKVEKALKSMKKDGMESVILDFRFNPGGLLTGAMDICRMFLKEDLKIVYTKGRVANSYLEYKSVKDAPYKDLPLVVLVNEMSASASEIVAGALKDNKRAVLIGERTFGKASVQTIIPLSDESALRLTIAKYYTPSGVSIHRDLRSDKPEDRGGIQPDIEVKVGFEDEIKLLRQFNDIYYPSKKQKKSAVEEKDQIEDVILTRAQEILKAKDSLKNL